MRCSTKVIGEVTASTWGFVTLTVKNTLQQRWKIIFTRDQVGATSKSLIKKSLKIIT
jgi:hypothetical protein